ncbi:MAG: hypothetical protein GX491_02590 [Chloroflexi bacterium]|nr:hypothetical protein [Chloroflexota bacterium]
MEMREFYQEKAEVQLREWQARIENFKHALSPSMSQSEQQQYVERLEDCQRTARMRLEELRSSRSDRWEQSKQAVERAMIELKKALDESGAGDNSIHLRTGRTHIYQPFERR